MSKADEGHDPGSPGEARWGLPRQQLARLAEFLRDECGELFSAPLDASHPDGVDPVTAAIAVIERLKSGSAQSLTVEPVSASETTVEPASASETEVIAGGTETGYKVRVGASSYYLDALPRELAPLVEHLESVAQGDPGSPLRELAMAVRAGGAVTRAHLYELLSQINTHPYLSVNAAVTRQVEAVISQALRKGHT
jgi:hypothetical protein